MSVRALSSTLKTLKACTVIAHSPKAMRLAEVARATGEKRASTYQRLATLVEAGWLEQSDGGAFRLSFKFQLFANSAAEQANLGVRVADELHQLMIESGETTSVSVLEGSEAVIIRRVESRQLLRADLRVGTPLALDRTASGQVLVAFARPSTIAHLRALGARLPDADTIETVRRTGFAVFSPAKPNDVAAVATPILDTANECIAALAISGPASRFDIAGCGAIALRAAQRISARLGGESL